MRGLGRRFKDETDTPTPLGLHSVPAGEAPEKQQDRAEAAPRVRGRGKVQVRAWEEE
jgi:hypothetical protein